jgi:hypothetical protein
MKVQDYALPREIPTETKEFLDDIRRILNNGGYVPQALSSVPGWSGEDGEWVFYALGNEQRNYVYNSLNGTWNYGVPLSSKYGWDYILVNNAISSATKGISFGYTYSNAPIVFTSFLGYSLGVPTTVADFTSGLTKTVTSGFAPTTTQFTAAVYSGDGSNFPGNYYMGISWLALG